MKNHLYLILLLSLFLNACKLTDEEKILGKWQNEQDWFEFKIDPNNSSNKIYDSGKDDIKMVRNFKYTIDPKRKELNLYTDDKNTTYYLIYEFIGNDTLAVRNSMSSNKTMIHFVRMKKNL